MTTAFSPVAWTGRHAPNLFVDVLQRTVSEPDRRVLQRPAARGQFARLLREALRQGGRGVAWEALMCYRPWDFSLRDIPGPVHIWVGDQDIFVSNDMVGAIQGELRHPILHRLPGEGHLCIEHWDDAFAAVGGGQVEITHG